MRVRILNELGRNTTPISNDPLHPISSGLHPFVQLLISFNSLSHVEVLIRNKFF